jgi:hypothetical protein
MPKRIELEVEGVTAVARLLDDQAPNTVNRFWEALPIEQKLRHVRWGGNAAYILEPRLKDPSFAVENRVSSYIPGRIAYKPEHGEFAISYAEAQARSLSGNGWATYFADFEGEYAPFLGMMQRTQREGAKQLVIRRKED